MAMLTVSLIAIVVANSSLLQWSATASAEPARNRLQATWLSVGALDWAQQILRDDTQSNIKQSVSSKASTFQILELNSFLGLQDSGNANSSYVAENDNNRLTMEIEDLQAKINLRNLILNRNIESEQLQILSKLFDHLKLDQYELKKFSTKLVEAYQPSSPDRVMDSALVLPQRFDDLIRFGLSPSVLEILRPFVTWLPTRTAININSAKSIVLYVSLPRLGIDGVDLLITERERKKFQNLNEVINITPRLAEQLTDAKHTTVSNFFEITFTVHTGTNAGITTVTKQAIIERDGYNTIVRNFYGGGSNSTRNMPSP